MIVVLAESPIVFERPIWLGLLVLIVPAFLLSLRSIGGLSRTKALVTFSLRTLVIVLLSMALAQPRWEKRGEGVTVTIILDRSLSVPWPKKQESLEFMRAAVRAKERREDRVAVITVARDASIAAMPDSESDVSAGQEPGDLTATNLAEGVRMALAIMPDDTANRIVIASDGNETMDSVLAAAEVARANGVPADVFLIEYDHRSEVIFERLIAPARVRQGQTADVRAVLRSHTETTGTLHLTMNGEPVDLTPGEDGDALAVTMSPGKPTVLPVPLSMERTGPQQFEARIEVDAPGDLPENNRGVAVTFVGGEGRVLVVDDDPAESENLIRALHEAGMGVDRTTPDQMIGGLVFLSGYDAVVLANIPRYAFDETQDRMIHAYVHDLGGGLIMLGGPQSFGAGGWIDSETSKVLPVELDPPSIQQMPRGALALLMHSCEMAQGNFWGQKVAQSAIEALSRLDYVGIVVFDWGGGGAGGINGCSWAFPMQEVGDKRTAINATKTMNVGDMPDFAPSMRLGLQGLQSVRAGQRHAIIISDGDPSAAPKSLLQEYVDARVTVTTIMVGGHGTPVDRNKMNDVAVTTGGRFYNVTNPKNLPQIFIKEAQLVSRSLIQEGDVYRPIVVSDLPGPVQGFTSVPPVDGYVLTAAREGLAQTTIVNPTEEGRDPIYAHWNYGLGKSIAYTSDLRGRWGEHWVSWAEFKAFWEQSVRWAMRPSSPANLNLVTRHDGDVAVVELEALDASARFLNFLRTSAVVVGPEGEGTAISLQQTGPGRYRGEFRTDDPGAYLVNVSYAGGSTDSPVQGNLQAAVSVPYSREFRSVTHNAALLRELAEQTGGRELASGDPALVDLFDRSDLEVPRTHRRIWDLLAILAAALFVFDVAARRLAVDPVWLLGLFGRAVRQRGKVTSGTVAAWKRTKQAVSSRQAREAARASGTAATARYEADEADRAKAIDVGAQAPADLRQKAAAVKREESGPPGAGAQEEGDYTTRLLRAKRRARGEGEEDGGGGAGGTGEGTGDAERKG